MIRILPAMVAAFAFLAGTSRAVGAGPEGATLWIDPEHARGGFGEIIQVTVWSDGLASVNTVDISIDFDPNILMFLGGAPGTFWTDYNGTFLAISNGVTAGNPGHYSLIAASPVSVWGRQSVITLSFLVVGVGETPLALGTESLGYTVPVYVDTVKFEIHPFQVLGHPSITGGATMNGPESLSQSDSPVSEGGGDRPAGFWDGDGVVYLRAMVDSHSVDDRLDVEVKPSSAPFDGKDLIQGVPAAGARAVCEVATPVLPEGEYHWRARLIASGTSISEWLWFGSGSSVDFRVGTEPMSSGGDSGGGTKGCQAASGRNGSVWTLLALLFPLLAGGGWGRASLLP